MHPHREPVPALVIGKHEDDVGAGISLFGNRRIVKATEETQKEKGGREWRHYGVPFSRAGGAVTEVPDSGTSSLQTPEIS